MLTFPGGKTRVLTFSYDDGISQDMRLVQLFNLYGLKGTFNLNSGIQSKKHTWQNQDVLVRRMQPDVLPELYRGHEVAVHTLTHPGLFKLTDEELADQGIGRNTIRLSIGTEHIDDIIADLSQAFGD